MGYEVIEEIGCSPHIILISEGAEDTAFIDINGFKAKVE